MNNRTDDAWMYEAFSRDAQIPDSFSDRLAESYDAIRRDSRGKEIDLNRNTKRHVRVTVLLAAAVAALSISALAIYQHSLVDAVLPDATKTEEVHTAAPQSAPEEAYTYEDPAADIQDQWLHMSLNGFSDSPEYRAYQEWNDWNDAWWEENPDPWAALGEDDSYFETPENFAYFYNASFPEQAEKLEEILDKYDLTPHTAMCGIESEEDLCAILGIGDLYSEEIPAVSGYMYDDGSFKTETLWPDEEPYRDMTVFFGVKGSFTMISGFMPADYEEWAYTAADGTEVLLALGHADGTPGDPQTPQDRGVVLAELEGGYVYAGFSGIADRAELEHWADCIGFAALDERFAPGTDTSDIAAAVEARFAETMAAN